MAATTVATALAAASAAAATEAPAKVGTEEDSEESNEDIGRNRIWCLPEFSKQTLIFIWEPCKDLTSF